MTITWNRLWIVLFSLTIFFALLALMKRSAFGLQMRAVTQNRRMASSMGIRTPWVDAFTFALGSGIAGIAGVALSQIDNVSPNLGQAYIIDSFMVVVFGGSAISGVRWLAPCRSASSTSSSNPRSAPCSARSSCSS